MERDVQHAGTSRRRACRTSQPILRAARRAGTLFVVATPIGNLQDLSPRAAACLRDADLLLAEDTRHTRKLLDACGIARAGGIESLHEHNERQRVPALLERLRAGTTSRW